MSKLAGLFCFIFQQLEVVSASPNLAGLFALKQALSSSQTGKSHGPGFLRDFTVWLGKTEARERWSMCVTAQEWSGQ